jgi:ABC-type uncharacterized transport system auxiliary subunit
MKKTMPLILLLTLLLASCGGSKSVVNRFYVLEYPARTVASMEEGLSPIEGSCLIETPGMHSAFATHQIALREDTHEIKYFSFNEWANRPEQSLATIIWSFYQDFPAFGKGAVLQGSGEEKYALQTHVSRMEVVQQRNDFYARLNVEFLLVERDTGTPLAAHKASRQEPLDQRNLNLFASAISDMFVEELQLFTLEIFNALQSAE